MQVVLLFFLLIPLIAFSKDNLGGKWFFNINQILQNISLESVVNDCSESPKNNNKNKYQACLVEVCGDPLSYTTTLDKYYSNLYNVEYRTDPKEGEIQKIINDYYNLDRQDYEEKKNLDWKSIITSFLKDKDAITSKEILNMLALIDLADIIPNLRILNEEKTEYIINEVEVNKFAGKERERIDIIKYQFINWANEYSLKVYHESDSDPFGTFLSINKSDISEAEKVDKIIEENFKRRDNIEDIIPDPFLTELVSKKISLDLKDKIKNKDIIDFELARLIKDEYILQYYEILASEIRQNQDYYHQKVKNDTISWFEKQNYQDPVETIYNSIIENNNHGLAVLENEYKRSLDKCLNSYMRNTQLLPTEEKVNQFKLDTKNYQNEFIDKLSLLKGISIKTQEILKNRIADLDFRFPLSKERWYAQLFNHLKESLNLNKNANEYSEKTKGEYSKAQPLYNLNLLKKNNPLEIDREKVADLEEVCDYYEQKPFRDATYTSFGKIILSPTIVDTPVYYKKSVVFHEIAHNLQKILLYELGISIDTKKNYNSNIECLEHVQGSIGVENTTHFMTEDFADFIASKFMGKGQKGDMCEYLQVDQTNGEYIQNTFINQSADDTHSSDLFRVLRNVLDRGDRLPTSCEEALFSEGISKIPTSCTF